MLLLLLVAYRLRLFPPSLLERDSHQRRGLGHQLGHRRKAVEPGGGRALAMHATHGSGGTGVCTLLAVRSSALMAKFEICFSDKLWDNLVAWRQPVAEQKITLFFALYISLSREYEVGHSLQSRQPNVAWQT